VDKHFLSIVVWLIFIACFGLSCRSLANAWVDGEIKRGRAFSANYRVIRRENEPESFKRYLLGVMIINICFALMLVIWGIALFLN
jgi:hypothetical protein